MKMASKGKLILFGNLFLAAVVFDLVKFLISGEPSLINWRSFVHAGWAVAAVALYFFSIRIGTIKFWRTLFELHFIVFFASLANQYFPYSSIFVYNCMLFNLVFVSIYFMLWNLKVK